MLTDGRTDGRTDGHTDERTEWGIAIALSQIGWLGANNRQTPISNHIKQRPSSVYTYQRLTLTQIYGRTRAIKSQKLVP